MSTSPTEARPFTVASYNVLADSYITPAFYPLVDPNVLNPSTRHPALVEHIARAGADILCLQEVEDAVFQPLCACLEPAGYVGARMQRQGQRADGCAMFLRSTFGRFVSSEPLRFSGSDNVAMVAVIHTGAKQLGIATVHLPWERHLRPEKRGRSQAQLSQLLSTIRNQARTCDAWIVCGDFNALPEDDVPRALIDARFTDAYREHPRAYTCNVNAETKRIDYLFSSERLIPLPRAISPIQAQTPLPSRSEPSDHLLIAAEYAWVP